MPYRRHTYWADMVNERTCIYRLFDSDGRLLYVGISMNLPLRMAKHRRRSWWPNVTRQTEVWFDGREAARAAERHALLTENPVWNIVRPRELSE